MLEIQNSPLVDALVNAMEMMGFLSPLPADPSAPPPSRAFLVSMPFTGPICGSIEMVVSEEVGINLAANILATTPSDPAAQNYAQDALKELLNVTCGLLLPKLLPKPADSGNFEM